MENVNFANVMEPIASAKVAAAEAAADKIAGIVTAITNVARDSSARAQQFALAENYSSSTNRTEKLEKESAGEVSNEAAAAILDGWVKFFEAIAALAEPETAEGCAVEIANAFLGRLVYAVRATDIKTEIASNTTKNIVKRKALSCILAVNRAAEAFRIAKATIGEEAVEAARVAVAAIRVAEAQGSLAFFELVQIEISDRLCCANEITNDSAFNTVEQFVEMVKKEHEQHIVRALAEEAAAKAALSDAKTEAAPAASSPSEMWNVLERYEAFARFYTAQSGIERDTAFEAIVQSLGISVAHREG